MNSDFVPSEFSLKSGLFVEQRQYSANPHAIRTVKELHKFLELAKNEFPTILLIQSLIAIYGCSVPEARTLVHEALAETLAETLAEE